MNREPHITPTPPAPAAAAPTPGELLARLVADPPPAPAARDALRQDFHNATAAYFAAHGIRCTFGNP